MSNYNGTKCISCEEIFKDGDDVVVCPVCGTPYHRECYNKEGECINLTLHESGESWKPEYEQSESGTNQSAEPVKCIRCGAENPPQGLFCSKCGMPLSGNQGARPFNGANENMNGQDFERQFGGFGMNGFNTMVLDENSDIDGIKLGDYAKYAGKNPISFLANFIRFGKNGSKISLNFSAFIVPELYFFYRKTPLIGVLMLLATVVISIPSIVFLGQSGMSGYTLLDTAFNLEDKNFLMISSICSYLEMGLRFLSGLFANYWYYKKARKDIIGIRNKNMNGDEQAVKQAIAEKGGVSWISVIVAVTVYFVLTSAIIIAINYLF